MKSENTGTLKPCLPTCNFISTFLQVLFGLYVPSSETQISCLWNEHVFIKLHIPVDLSLLVCSGEWSKWRCEKVQLSDCKRFHGPPKVAQERWCWCSLGKFKLTDGKILFMEHVGNWAHLQKYLCKGDSVWVFLTEVESLKQKLNLGLTKLASFEGGGVSLVCSDLPFCIFQELTTQLRGMGGSFLMMRTEPWSFLNPTLGTVALFRFFCRPPPPCHFSYGLFHSLVRNSCLYPTTQNTHFVD